MYSTSRVFCIMFELSFVLLWLGTGRLHPYPYCSDVIKRAMVSQITGVTIVCSTICSGADQRKHQSSSSLDFFRGIHRWPMDYVHKGPETRKMFPFDDAIMHQEPLMLTWINFIVACRSKASIKKYGMNLLTRSQTSTVHRWNRWSLVMYR